MEEFGMNTVFLIVFGVAIIISVINASSSHNNTNHQSLATLARVGWAAYGVCMVYMFLEVLSKMVIS
jgi:hypothetical protein